MAFTALHVATRRRLLVSLAALLTAPGCGGSARLPVEAGMGPTPTLPEPSTSLIPTINVAEAVRSVGGK